MALRYLIPAGEQPDDAHADFYQQQEDGSYLLHVTGLPHDQPQDEPDEDTSADSVAEQMASAEPDTCHGGGAHHAMATSASTSSTLIAPDDGEAISQSISALASGAIRLGR